jgi:hypothetical protein
MICILKGIKGVSAKNTQETYLGEGTSLARFSKSSYGCTHTTHINELYLKWF